MNLAPIKTKEKRKIVSLASDYAFDVLNVEEVFVEVSSEDKSLENYLESHNYENLGDQDGKIIYLKEKEEEKSIQRMIA